jgi:CheY-like chemotaxis protein
MRTSRRVLIVDDNPINVSILEEALETDYQIDCADNAEEAIRLACLLRPAVILLDVMMPGMDGLEACQRIRQLPGMDRVKIIMMSAKAMPSEMAAGLDAGADDYLTKPFDESELLAILRRYISSPRQMSAWGA